MIIVINKHSINLKIQWDLYPEYIKIFYSLRTKKKTNLQMSKGFEKTFLQKSTQMASKHMKRRSTPLVIREMQIKTRMSYTRIALIKKNNFISM